jgi:hypothetical protein
MTPFRFSCLLAGLILVLAALAAAALGQGEIGYVRITSSPGGAFIYIDDVYHGTTVTSSTESPTIAVDANVQHTLRLAKDGYQPYSTTFTVAPGVLRDFQATLTPVPTSSTFGTTPMPITSRSAGTTVPSASASPGVDGCDWPAACVASLSLTPRPRCTSAR